MKKTLPTATSAILAWAASLLLLAGALPTYGSARAEAAPSTPVAAVVTDDTVRVRAFGDLPFEAAAELPFAGPYTLPEFCGLTGPYTYTSTAADGASITIDPEDGTTDGGSICVEWCRAADTSVCQRVVFAIQRVNACAEEVLRRDTARLPTGGPDAVCLGGGVDLRGFEIAVDGATVSPGTSPDCRSVDTIGTGVDREVYAYDVAFLTDGPLRIDGWEANGIFFEGVTAGNLARLADSLDFLDAGAAWRYVPERAAILADTDAGNYSPLILFDLSAEFSAQLPLETRVVEAGSTTEVPGATVDLPGEGTYVVTVFDPEAVCGDRQIIIREASSGTTPTRDTVRQEVDADVANGPFCLSVAELPSDPTSIATCADPSNGTIAFERGNCYRYTPNLDYRGPDTACVVICAGATCDTTVVAFDVRGDAVFRPARDTIAQDVRAGSVNGPYCLPTDELPPGPYTASSCALPQNGTLAFEDGRCYTYAPAAGFVGRDTACVVVCAGDGVTCDTTVVLLAITDAPDCSEFAALTPDAFTLPNCGATATFEFSTGTVDPATVRLRLNGRAVDVDARQQVFALTLPAGRYTVVATDTVTGCASFFDVTVECDPECLLPFSETEVVRFVECGRGDLLSVCLPTTLAALEGFEIGLDGVPYTGTPRACDAGAGVLFDIPLGAPIRSLRFVRDDSTCLQDIAVELVCISSSAEAIDVPLGGDVLFCASAAELNGPIVTLEEVCGEGEEAVGLDFDGVVGCVTLRGVDFGSRRVCLVACDRLGVCDTTFVTATVVEPREPTDPLGFEAADDDYRLRLGETLEADVFANDVFAGALSSVRIARRPARGLATLSEDGRLTYTPDAEACDLVDTLRYEICQADLCDQAAVTIRIRCSPVEAYEGFSPNGDGVNDFFIVEGIEDLPDSELTIYNRWGNEVFSATGYRNDWGGTWDDDTLVDGTYFYVLDLGDGGEPLSGWVFLWR